jgi:hypothetical protein
MWPVGRRSELVGVVSLGTHREILSMARGRASVGPFPIPRGLMAQAGGPVRCSLGQVPCSRHGSHLEKTPGANSHNDRDHGTGPRVCAHRPSRDPLRHLLGAEHCRFFESLPPGRGEDAVFQRSFAPRTSCPLGLACPLLWVRQRWGRSPSEHRPWACLLGCCRTVRAPGRPSDDRVSAVPRLTLECSAETSH